MNQRIQTLCLVVAVMMIPAAGVWADPGGPDTFGHLYTDAYPFDWLDTAAGTAVSLSDDSHSAEIPLDFIFPFYGANVESMYLGSNGFISFWEGSGSLSNHCPPNPTAPNGAIYGYWDDLNPSYGGSHIRYLTLGDEPDRVLAVEYNVPHYGSSTNFITFQLILYEATGTIIIQFQEASTEAGSSGTTGIENVDGSDGLGLVCNEAVLVDELAFCIIEDYALAADGEGSGAVLLTWDDNIPADDGYLVERSPTSGSGFEEVGEADPDEDSFIDTGLDECSHYYYRIAGLTETGEFPAGAEAHVLTLPNAPEDLATDSVQSTQITLIWTDASECEDGYVVKRADEAGGDYTAIASLDPNETTYTDTGLIPGQTYYYVICASFDDDHSSCSDEVSQNVMLEAPTDLTAGAASGTEVELAWADNSLGEDGFSVERKEGTDGTFAEIANVGEDTVFFLDSGLEAETTYVYRVRAVANNVFSDYTNEAEATTPSGEDTDDDDDDDDEGDGCGGCSTL